MTSSSCIHTYLFLYSIHKVSHYSQPRSCPDCKYAAPPSDDGLRWGPYQTHDVPLWGGNQDLHYLSLADYQAGFAVRDSSEFQTSGCDTPRRSAESLNSSRFSGDVGFDEK